MVLGDSRSATIDDESRATLRVAERKSLVLIVAASPRAQDQDQGDLAMHSSTQLTASAHEQPSLSGLTGTDALFDTLVDSIASQIGSAVPGVSANELRTRLLAFRPRFEAIYQGVLQEHLGTDLARLTKELREPKVRAYFDARRRMAPELGRLLQELCVQMGETRV